MNKGIMGIVLSGVLVASGCASEGGQKSSAATGTNRPAETTTSQTVEPEPTTEDTPSEDTSSEESVPDTELHFGQSFEWEDGLSMTIGKPKKFRPDQDLWDYPTAVKFQVTIVNKTGKRFDPSMFSATMQKGNEEAEQIFDSVNGVEGPPQTKLLNGREAKFVIAFAAKPTDDLVLEVAPSFEHDSVIYTP